jgi:hypothetical protein
LNVEEQGCDKINPAFETESGLDGYKCDTNVISVKAVYLVTIINKIELHKLNKEVHLNFSVPLIKLRAICTVATEYVYTGLIKWHTK